ncbi:hypothetical protein EJ110_NYTH29756 [Nymphaea thermarum]|nr:hypothetical protein EJ110_NYTH29756 [Nymphaea thermarum]
MRVFSHSEDSPEAPARKRSLEAAVSVPCEKLQKQEEGEENEEEKQSLINGAITIARDLFGEDVEIQRMGEPPLGAEMLGAGHVRRRWTPQEREGQVVGLIFPADVRRMLDPPLLVEYYGNAFLLASMGRQFRELLAEQIHQTVKGIQSAKEMVLSDAYACSSIDMVAVHQPVDQDDTTSNLIVSQWCRLGLERVDFGSAPPALLSSTTVDHYCLLLPLLGKET